jgi:hypothetical protein
MDAVARETGLGRSRTTTVFDVEGPKRHGKPAWIVPYGGEYALECDDVLEGNLTGFVQLDELMGQTVSDTGTTR